MTPPLILASVLCLAFTRFHWAAWLLWPAVLTVMTGRDPLWLSAAALTWLRGQFICFGVALRIGYRAFAKTRSVSVDVAREQAWDRAKRTNADALAEATRLLTPQTEEV